MGKHHHHHLIRDSLKSFFEPHLLHLDYGETKTEIDEKVKKILRIVESGDTDEEDESKRVMVVELVKEFYREYESLYRQYEDLTGEIRKQIHEKEDNQNSSSSSSSDLDSDTERNARRVKKKQTKTANLDLKRKNLDELESELEREKEEKPVLLNQINDLEKAYVKLSQEHKQINGLFEEREVTIKKLKDDNKKAQETLEETVENLRNQVEVKGEEIEGLTEKMSNIEVKLRLSNQKLRITEQVLTEKEEESKRIETKYLEKQALLEVKIRGLIEENSERILNRFQSLSEKLKEKCGSYEETVVEATKMLKFVIEMKKEKEEMEKKLEGKVREEEEEKEKLKERLLDLGEEKREAIRQLCIWIDHHRDRCEYLEEFLSKMVLARRQR